MKSVSLTLSLFFIGSFLVLVAGVCTPWMGTSPPKLADIILPEGFEIYSYATDVTNARSMCMGDKGTIFVGTRSGSKVYALRDEDGDYVAEKKYLLADGLNMPNGVAFKDGSLYVAEVNRIIRFDNIEANLENPPEYVVIKDDYPSETHHGWKYIAFGPDGKLYVPVGAPCNICDEPDPFNTIWRMNPDGTEAEVYARGIRNSVGFAWNPKDNSLWFTDNGRDWAGDDIPPDELNRAPEPNMHFGYPYCHAGEYLDDEFGAGKNCDDYTAPKQQLGPHVAALGVLFYTGDMFPPEYKDKLLICEHGSWNRSDPLGYRVTMVDIEGENASNYGVFAEGWLQNKKAKGRPVALLQLEDGSVLISDDKSGQIYRVVYNK